MTRFLKTLHGWLGLLVLPWVILAGATGFYENHAYLVLKFLPDTRFQAAMLAALPPHPVDQIAVQALAQSLLPQPSLPVTQTRLLTRPAYEVMGPGETLQVDQATGAYALIGPYETTLYRADGGQIARQVQWGKLLQRLHHAGWASDRFGTWPADTAALALVVFGISGLWLFLAPRLRRLRNRWRNRPSLR